MPLALQRGVYPAIAIRIIWDNRVVVEVTDAVRLGPNTDLAGNGFGKVVLQQQVSVQVSGRSL